MHDFRRLAAASLCLAAFPAFGQPAEAISTQDGVFTQEQAERGEALFSSSCARCHGGNLQATDPEAANLTGPAFETNWLGQTLRQRFERIRYTMPPNAPDSLPPEDYLDIMTYILSFNGQPSGDTELALDLEALAEIVVE